MGGTKPLQSVINTNYSVDIASSSCTNGKFHSHPILNSQSVLSLYAKLTGLQDDEKLPASSQRENH
jgi:hypothetical protein